MAVVGSGRTGSQARRAPTVDDILDLVQVSAGHLSPDGMRVIFTRSELKKWKDNKRVSSIWIAGTDGHDERRFLGSDKDQAPFWSPDGKQLAFLSTRDQPSDENAKNEPAHPQIWVIAGGGGEAWKLTSQKGTIKSFEWAPDGSQIFFVAEDAVEDKIAAAEKSGDDTIFVDEGANGQERAHFVNLWVVSLANKAERQITHDKLLIESFRPSPDAQKIALTYRRENSRNGQFHIEVAIADAKSGTLKDLTSNQAPEQAVRWTPDGSMVSFLAPDDKSWELAEEKLWVVPVQGGPERRVAEGFSGAIHSYFWAPDGKSIYVGGTKNGRSGIFQADASTPVVRTIATGDWSGGLDSVSSDLTRGALVLSTPGSPGDVAVVDLARGEIRKITNTNPHVTGFALAQFKAVTWKSQDGREIEGLLWLPGDYKPGVKLPLILSIHGGPAGVWTTSFRGINHVYAGLGWAILEPNVRGSSSYGDALLRGNLKDIGGGDYQDLISGVDALIAQGIADPDHLALRGWSYGGILGGWTITQTTRFKAASLGAMVSDWASEYAMGFNHDVRLWYIGGTPWENPNRYREQSAYSHIAEVTTPTLILHGERDTTDTIGQSMIFYQGLKDRGVPVRFVRFPREPHGFGEPHHQRIRDTEEIAWLMKYARGIDWKAPDRIDKDEPDGKRITAP
jgi:dipeptidyl aminopeptidase/acylaminoacyl peptidase